MYHVRIASDRIDDEVALTFSADGRLDDLQIADGPIARDVVIEFDPGRRTLDFACTIDAAIDARLAILLAGSEFDKHLELLGATGVHIQHAEAGPEIANRAAPEAPADFVTSAEAASIAGVDTRGFKHLAGSAGFPPVCGHIDVYSRSAVTRWAEVQAERAAAA